MNLLHILETKKIKKKGVRGGIRRTIIHRTRQICLQENKLDFLHLVDIEQCDVGRSEG